nr:hypothetical protein [Tanacetum cinerariifolium]
MGASESTARTNGTNPNNNDDDEPNQKINPLGAAAALAAAGVAAWAEFHGICHGLRLLAKLGYRDSVLESDSSAAIEWIKKDSYRLKSPVIKECWEMISECKRLVHENGIDIKCISRDDNKCADKLAFMAIEKQDTFVEIYDRPNEIKQIVH